MDGFLNLLKPPGMTSSDAVLFVRRLLPKKTAVGHGGTLDPDAAGVLPVCVGRATRLFDYMIDKQKTYIAELRLGMVTDTQDATGTILARHSPVAVTADEVRAVLNEWIGTVWQTPPAYSALKRDGKKLCDLARKGEAPIVEPRRVHIHAIEYLTQTGPDRHLLRVTCGKGVYIRTLLHDIGARLGCGGHMAFLLRSAAGAFSVEQTVTLQTLSETDVATHLLPMDFPLETYPRIDLPERCRASVRNGAPIPWRFWTNAAPEPLEAVRVYLEGTFAGMGWLDADGIMRFRAMLLPIS